MKIDITPEFESINTLFQKDVTKREEDLQRNHDLMIPYLENFLRSHNAYKKAIRDYDQFLEKVERVLEETEEDEDEDYE